MCVCVSAYMFVLYASIMRSESVCVGEGACAFRHPSICVYSSVPVRVDCASVMGGAVRDCASDLQPAFICISAYLCICMHELACMCMQANVHIITI